MHLFYFLANIGLYKTRHYLSCHHAALCQRIHDEESVSNLKWISEKGDICEGHCN